MSNLTYATQLRRVTVTDRVARYLVAMDITDRGRLPDDGLFLMSIVDASDPKSDALVRVARIADMIAVPKDRVQALREFSNLYRTASLTKIYDDVESARAAASYLKERVNATVTDYITYEDTFKADPAEVVFFPQSDLAALSNLIGDYTRKVVYGKELDAAIAVKQASCSQLTADYAAASARVASRQETLQALNSARASVQFVSSAFVSQQTVGQEQLTRSRNACTAWAGVRASAAAAVQTAMDPHLQAPSGLLYAYTETQFTQSLQALALAQAGLVAQLALLDQQIASQTTQLQAEQATLATLLQAKENCAAEIAAAQAHREEVARTEGRLLDEIRSLCPDYEP